MDDLVSWLEAQIAEDERVAQSATVGPWEWDGDSVDAPADPTNYVARYRWIAGDGSETEGVLAVDGEHIAAWNPSRVLAECEAKRLVLDRLKTEERVHNNGGTPGAYHWAGGRRSALTEVAQLWAAVYVKQGRSGYRPEWTADVGQ